MAPTGRKAPRGRRDRDGQQSAARTPLPPHRGPRPANRAAPSPPAPLRGRGPAGSGAAEGGAGSGRGGEALSLGRQRALLHAGRGGGAQP